MRFEAMREHLSAPLPRPHVVILHKRMKGEDVPYAGAVKAIARQLATIEAGARLMTYDDPPRFLEGERIG